MNLRTRFERFCFKHRDKGIRNLMLYITLGSAIVYILSIYDQSLTLYNALCFDRDLILQGQLWRLVSYAITYDAGSILLTAIGLICYYSLGKAVENAWGTLRFNLFYLSGIVLMDIFALIFGAKIGNGWVSTVYLNTSLFLAYATMYPNSHFLLLFIIPVKAWIFGMIDLIITVVAVVTLTEAGLFPFSLFPLVAIGNYLLFFGKDVGNIFPNSWRMNFKRLFRKKSKTKTGTIPFPTAGSYKATVTKVKAPYNHCCTVCGRTDVSNPELDFRYCSRCTGYHCYCQDHINDHAHIQN